MSVKVPLMQTTCQSDVSVFLLDIPGVYVGGMCLFSLHWVALQTLASFLSWLLFEAQLFF